MDYKRFGNTIVARLDKGEEIVEQVKKLAELENVRLANINALGAVGEFTVGVFKTADKKYEANSFSGDFEIVSLTGSISTMNHGPYIHLHMSAGDAEGQVYGGHLNRAVVSATCELFAQVIDGSVDRKFSDEIGLNLFEF